MKEAELLGTLLPSHPDILPMVRNIREKFGIPEISSKDDSLKILLEHELEIDWKAVHGEILEKLKELPDLIPEKTKKVYVAIKKLQTKPLTDPEFDKVSQEFKNNIEMLFDLVLKNYEPIIQSIDKYYQELANLCVEFLLTGEAREVPETWISAVEVTDSMGEQVIYAMANKAADPDEVAEKFKTKYYDTFGPERPKITEAHIQTADYLRMKWEGKSISYILEEDDLRNPEGKSKRHSTSVRKRHSKMRQRLHRLQKALNEIFK